MQTHNKFLPIMAMTAFTAAILAPVSSARSQMPNAANDVTYADLVDVSDAAEIVLRAEIRKQAEVEPERAPGLQAGFVRLYIEARTTALLSGSAPVGESLRYLVDVPLTARGKAPKLKKSTVLLFGRTVRGRPGEIQLVDPTAQLRWSESREARLRTVLAQLVAPEAAPQITGIRDALSIAGNLAGESETQLFLSTADDGPVSVSVIRRPGQATLWGVSWSEIVDQAARPPQPGTLAWYRLACFLPDRLPRSAIIASDAASRQRAREDYRFVRDQLGPCPRNRGA